MHDSRNAPSSVDFRLSQPTAGLVFTEGKKLRQAFHILFQGRIKYTRFLACHMHTYGAALVSNDDIHFTP